MMNSRAISIICIIAFMCVAFSGCGSPDTQSNDTPSQEAREVEASQSPEVSAASTEDAADEDDSAQQEETISTPVSGQLTVSFTFNRVDSRGTNQFAIWIEDAAGKYVDTIAATSFTADGGFSMRPASIPTWVEKSGLANMDSNAVDAISSATPGSGEVEYVWNCTDSVGTPVEPGTYRFVVEGTADFTDEIGRSIIFSGEIELGDESAESTATVERSDDYAEEQGMITDVKASFISAG